MIEEKYFPELINYTVIQFTAWISLIKEVNERITRQ